MSERAPHVSGSEDRDTLDRIGNRLQMPLRHVQVDRGVLQIGVPEQLLDSAKIRAILEQVSGPVCGDYVSGEIGATPRPCISSNPVWT